jgi:hypothetical protein
MAPPIKATPFLQGQDSNRFNQQLEANKDKKASKEEKERILNLVDAILSKMY